MPMSIFDGSLGEMRGAEAANKIKINKKMIPTIVGFDFSRL
jgi:hypothetical protein